MRDSDDLGKAMRLAEIRDLDGPNLFMLEPAIKVELNLDNPEQIVPLAARLRAAGVAGGPAAEDPIQDATTAAAALVRLFDPAARLIVRWLETPGCLAIAFSWSHRRFAIGIARLLANLALGQVIDLAAARDAITRELDTTVPDDQPLIVRDKDRRIPIVGITGTNGKTTTTRLLAHILMIAGKHVGWSSSSGVYIDGVAVLEGDYSGPSGARRVLQDPAVEVAVLETARGGILLRGIAYQSNDVGVFTNISPDHLDLQGIKTVQGLAEVKSVVVRVTRPGGTAVLNADDPLVMAATREIVADRLLFSRDPASHTIHRHTAKGGRALMYRASGIWLIQGEREQEVASVADLPFAYGGKATHMVENGMAAAGAALGLGLDLSTIRRGLESFRSSSELNLGRLNVFILNGVTVILDYAHNEAGTEQLIAFARSFLGEGGKLAMVIGTAGDRTDHSLSEIGRLAASAADRVVIKASPRYLRGRGRADLVAQLQRGIRAAGKAEAPDTTSELEGLQLALTGASRGDVVAVMAQEQLAAITDYLCAAGATPG